MPSCNLYIFLFLCFLALFVLYVSLNCSDIAESKSDLIVGKSLEENESLPLCFISKLLEIVFLDAVEINIDELFLVVLFIYFKLVLSEQVTETITDGEETNSEDTAEESENTTNEETETTEVTSYKLAATFVCKDIRLNIVDPVPEDTTDGENAEETEESGTEETNEKDEENSTEEDDA